MWKVAALLLALGLACLSQARVEAQIPNIKYLGFTGAKPPTIAPQGNITATGASTTHTFSGMAIGAASSDRYVVATITGNAAASLSSATIGGVSATIAKSQLSIGTGVVWIIYALVTSGTTADVVANTGSTVSRWGCSTFSMTGWGGTKKVTNGSNNSNNLTLTLSLTGKAAVAGVIFSANAGVGDPSYGNTWTGLTEYQDTFFSFSNAGSAYGNNIAPGTGITVVSGATASSATAGATIGFSN